MKAAIELGQNIGDLLGEIAGQLERMRDLAAVMRHQAGGRIDREGHDLVGRVVRDLLDVHAAFGRHHESNARGFAVNQRREIELTVDRRTFFDVKPVDDFAVRAGLMRHQRRAEDAGRLRFFTSSMDFTTLTPPALPRPPAWICAFTTQTGPPSSLARLDRFIDGERGHAARHRDAEFAQDGFRLILVNIHTAVPSSIIAVAHAQAVRPLRAPTTCL